MQQRECVGDAANKDSNQVEWVKAHEALLEIARERGEREGRRPSRSFRGLRHMGFKEREALLRAALMSLGPRGTRIDFRG